MSNSKNLLASQIEALPEYFSNAAQRQEKPLVNGTALTILFNIEKLLPQQKEWVDRMVALLCENNERKYINEVLVPVVLNPELCTSFSKALLSFTKKNLQYRVDNKPQPPANWSRPVPKKQKNLRIWKLLESFLESPVEQVFDFRKERKWKMLSQMLRLTFEQKPSGKAPHIHCACSKQKMHMISRSGNGMKMLFYWSRSRKW